MTEATVNKLEGAESRDWMASRPALRKAIIINKLVLPEPLEVVANILAVWPLIVAYLKETGRKGDGKKSNGKVLFIRLYFYNFVPMYVVFVMFKRKGWMRTFISTSSSVSGSVCSTCCLKYVSF